MPAAKKRPRHADPYRGYTFRVKWDGRLVAGITRVSALKRTTAVVEYREGTNAGATRKLPGVTGFEGITHDADFETWARLVAGTAEPLLAFRKEVRIEVCDADGHVALAYNIHRCWPSEYVALSDLETGSDCALIQSLTLQNEGWERDTSIKAPTHRKA
jgi:phage tail-like protein